MLDPLTFILWFAVATALLFWGRGAYCGWLCPFGALQELTNRQPGSANVAHEHIHESEQFSSVSLQIDGPVNANRLARGLADADLGLVRAKGFVEDVSGEMKVIQVVGRRWDVTPAPQDATPSLIAIALREKCDRSAIQAALDDCKG